MPSFGLGQCYWFYFVRFSVAGIFFLFFINLSIYLVCWFGLLLCNKIYIKWILKALIYLMVAASITEHTTIISCCNNSNFVVFMSITFILLYNLIGCYAPYHWVDKWWAARRSLVESDEIDKLVHTQWTYLVHRSTPTLYTHIVYIYLSDNMAEVFQLFLKPIPIRCFEIYFLSRFLLFVIGGHFRINYGLNLPFLCVLFIL